LAVACGCYSPHPQPGAPCDPASSICPSGQMCVSEATGYFCETHLIIDALVPDGAPDAPPDAQTIFTYVATVAECINPALPDPDTCRSIKGNAQLVADGSDASTMQPWYAYVRFDLDGRFAGQSIKTVHLRLTVTDDSLAASASSGAIWQVAMFDKPSLYTTVPAMVGSAAIAPAQSSIQKLEVVTFSIPTDLVAANGSLYLGVISTSTDGVNYWNLDGANPPRLDVIIK